ncbi:hypothetical protein L6452_35703 [Arctium lappa]|uniref:Uncharacterized protein n=1 Tax=Arctium lappa TaxID=4217 RepID=A0ACB8Y7T7_ARCLA|nr:hypothetical protein L6452_35703 [Arctium lappa]
MDTGLQQDEVHVNARYHKYTLSEKYNVFERNPQASAAEDLRDLRLLKIYVIDTILADGVDHLGMLGFRLRRLSSIRFERCTPSLSSSADLRLHRTFV